MVIVYWSVSSKATKCPVSTISSPSTSIAWMRPKALTSIVPAPLTFRKKMDSPVKSPFIPWNSVSTVRAPSDPR